MATQLKYFTTALCLLVISTSAYCALSKDVLVNSNKLKSKGFLDGQMGTVNVDLNGDGYQDIIEYTFSSTTPPGTCDQSDCMSSLDTSPILTFQIKMHDGKSIDGSYMCTSLGVSKELRNGMKDILCGPKYILRWNGEEYDAD
ncbi:hypothetical protein AIQ71_03515 [Salmonella enterica]|uniref:Secreted protein n=3 Tax=Salmonella enterica TaxID=28901 RepID=A0A379SV99_SALER|nr:hypothetical protein [Salmonella enterica]EAO6002104.1 hypothetical protein [Salmonella enterica subsp. arizonae serovar 62:z36:-]EAR4276180.1 hypothetical protein [Salmonella enterica subsp. arizonae serovar 13,23:gz51:-]EBF3616129.1 hypothetical protein [Salmonella enterica subsp. arizonae serovar [1],13,23:g,z51:-]EBH8073959.1 hypothetical protein [Salmonella bongori]EBP3362005.1 hypothetical protein [Salmonella enterica subsp. enterica]ECC1653534.1 hypothetical protein [Salmonella ente